MTTRNIGVRGIADTIAHPLARAAGAIALLLALAMPAGAQSRDPFGDRSWNLELGSHLAIETWNYNISHETMFATWQGFNYGLRKGLVLKAAWPLYYIEQRGSDAFLLGTTIGLRGRALGGPRAAGFWEFEVGVSRGEHYTPPGGTRFNYLALGAIGVTVRAGGRLHAVASLRWVHVSNNGLAGRSRNPDIEAVGPHVGVIIPF